MRSQKKVFTKASDRIRMEIEEAIKDGSLLPGESVDEAELALQYDVSRTPVREALLQLQAQGLLTSLPRGGMIVAKMDLQQLLSLWELLAELEGVAVRLACQRMTPEELDIIVRHHEASRKVAEADDVAGWQESNLRFHELIYRATRNPYLRQEVLRMRTPHRLLPPARLRGAGPDPQFVRAAPPRGRSLPEGRCRVGVERDGGPHASGQRRQRPDRLHRQSAQGSAGALTGSRSPLFKGSAWRRPPLSNSNVVSRTVTSS